MKCIIPICITLFAVTGFAGKGMRIHFTDGSTRSSSLSSIDSITFYDLGSTSIENAQVIPYSVTDAEYSKVLDRVVLISAVEQKLFILDPLTNESQEINLVNTPTCIAISPTDSEAVVGYDGWVSHIDLSTMEIINTFSVSTRALDIIFNGNKAYIFPQRDQWENIRQIDLLTGDEALHTGSSIYAGTRARLHPSGDYIYGADNGLSPNDCERYNITGDTIRYEYDSKYHGDFSFSGNIWITENGKYIIARSGNIFSSSPLQEEDITYVGSLGSLIIGADHSSEAELIAVIRDNAISFYEDAYFNDLGTLNYKDCANGMSTKGSFIFFSGNGEYLITVGTVETGSNWSYSIYNSSEYPQK